MAIRTCLDPLTAQAISARPDLTGLVASAALCQPALRMPSASSSIIRSISAFSTISAGDSAMVSPLAHQQTVLETLAEHLITALADTIGMGGELDTRDQPDGADVDHVG